MHGTKKPNDTIIFAFGNLSTQNARTLDKKGKLMPKIEASVWGIFETPTFFWVMIGEWFFLFLKVCGLCFFFWTIQYIYISQCKYIFIHAYIWYLYIYMYFFVVVFSCFAFLNLVFLKGCWLYNYSHLGVRELVAQECVARFANLDEKNISWMTKQKESPFM